LIPGYFGHHGSGDIVFTGYTACTAFTEIPIPFCSSLQAIAATRSSR
jgi:hypothetical protein